MQNSCKSQQSVSKFPPALYSNCIHEVSSSGAKNAFLIFFSFLASVRCLCVYKSSQLATVRKPYQGGNNFCSSANIGFLKVVHGEKVGESYIILLLTTVVSNLLSGVSRTISYNMT